MLGSVLRALAGNASLEEVALALELRGANLMGGLRTGLDIKHIALTSRMVTEYTGMAVQPHKAIVGANAFAHESGIHQVRAREVWFVSCPSGPPSPSLTGGWFPWRGPFKPRRCLERGCSGWVRDPSGADESTTRQDFVSFRRWFRVPISCKLSIDT